MERTADPYVRIEERRPGYVRYRQVDPETRRVVRRWEVHGVCDRRGDCLVGAVVGGVEIVDLAHLRRLTRRLGRDRVDSALDVPVAPGFRGCCPLRIVEV
jgi:hypothetical protein